jgi:hypothetical protein
MNMPLDPETAGLERRLGQQAMWGPPPGLRTRVLRAVDDELAAPGPVPAGGADGLFSGWPWATVAAGITLVAIAWWPSREAVHVRAPLTFAERVRAAGLADDTLVAAAKPAPPRSASPPSAGDDTRRSMIRASDSRHLLELHFQENF